MIRSTFFPLFFLAVLAFSSGAVSQESVYGPPVEIGVAVRGYRFQSRADWSSKYSYAGGGNIAIRLFRGLAVQAGRDVGKGDEPRPDLIDYGDGYKLWTNEKSYQDVTWYGLRYEVPSHYLNITYAGIDFICIGTGMQRTKFGLYSSYKFSDQNGEKVLIDLEEKKKFRVATMTGPYVSLSGRWKFDTHESKGTGSWLGAFGLEFGGRYNFYTDSSLRYENVPDPRDSFNSYELFLIAFMKIELLY